jgi:hypothetical protein
MRHDVFIYFCNGARYSRNAGEKAKQIGTSEDSEKVHECERSPA